MKKKRILIFGASGMLGSMLLDLFSKEKDFLVTATVRDAKALSKLKHHYPDVTFEKVDIHTISQKQLTRLVGSNQWVVNAIGAIKPTIPDNLPQTVEQAIQSNILFPLHLADAIKGKNIRVLQIATDCVFADDKPSRLESDMHNATDIYGKTKSLGEVVQKNYFHLRVSIIGPEIFHHRSLLAWFLDQPRNASLNGFANHLWNGITTLHFAKICLGIIKNDIELTDIQHIIPRDRATKARLLKLFATTFQRKDITLVKTKAKVQVRRTLSTLHDKMNQKLWELAGYKNPPTIKDMIDELAEYMKNNL